MNKLISIICIFSVFCSSSAFAYKRDVPPSQQSSDKETVSEPAAEKQPAEDYGYGYKPRGNGLMITSYILIGLGGAAAIAGSTIAVSTDKQVTGEIIAASGAAMGLAGSLMMLIGGTSYGVGPQIDPVHKTYGLAMKANF